MELLWFKVTRCAAQMHLVVDLIISKNKGRSAFVDIFVGNTRRYLGVNDRVLALELKNVTLRALWKALQSTKSAEVQPDVGYKSVLKQLREATEEQLLAMQFTYYENQKRQWITLQVKDVLHEATAGLSRYTNVISSGPATSTCAGILDNRVYCQEGTDVVWDTLSYVLAVHGYFVETQST